jgi:hypothetical protein
MPLVVSLPQVAAGKDVPPPGAAMFEGQFRHHADAEVPRKEIGMKRLICMVAIALAVSASGALAQGPSHYSGGLGFHRSEAPVGVRWWLTGQKIALDAGVGFGSTDIGDESLSNWAIDLGLPIALRTWDKVHFMVRPGVLYQSQEEFDPTPPVGFDTTDTGTQLTVLGELEAEVFLADNVSVSASHGIGIVNTNPAFGGPSATNWSTFGANFTEVGFHVYLFGPSR